MLTSLVTTNMLSKLLIWLTIFFVFFIFASCVQRLISEVREKRRVRLELGFRLWLKDAVEAEKKFRPDLLPKEFRKMEAMIPVLEESDRTFSGKWWKDFREGITIEFLLPKARKMAKSFSLNNRHFAVRSFVLAPLVADEAILLELLSDKADSVRIEAAICAVLIGSEVLLTALMQRLSKEPERLHFAYKDALKSGTSETVKWLVSQFSKENNPELQIVYIEVLAVLLGDEVIELVKPLISSSDSGVKLAAVRALALHPPKSAFPELLALAGEPDPRIRIAAATALRIAKGEDVGRVLQQLLDDPKLKVQLAAANALRKSGRKSVLKMSTESSPSAAFVLALPEDLDP